MNRWDEIQATARDVAEQIQPDPERRDSIADNLIKLVGLMIQATGKGVAIEGESEHNDDPDDMSAHNRYMIGEQMQRAARTTVDESSNAGCDLDRYERSGLQPAWVSKVDRTEIRQANGDAVFHTWGRPRPLGRLTEAANAAAEAVRGEAHEADRPRDEPPHAPSKAVLCPDCRTKGHAVCAGEADAVKHPAQDCLTHGDAGRVGPCVQDCTCQPIGTYDGYQHEASCAVAQAQQAADVQPLQHTWIPATVSVAGVTLDNQHCGVCGIAYCNGGCGDASVGAAPDVDCPVHGDEIALRCFGPTI